MASALAESMLLQQRRSMASALAESMLLQQRRSMKI
jgi:hypothetical protein